MALSQPAADLNLLFGILALQLDFLNRDQLVVAMNAWVLDKSQSLGAILVTQKVLSPERHTLLQALVQEHLQQHHHDPQQSLAAVSSVGSLRKDLEQIADAEVQASLGHVCAAHQDDPSTIAHVGTPTSSGLRFRILRPHARGGLGEVHIAYDEELHREVALKEIQDRHADQPASRSRFVLEAEITGGLEHPGIVPVYGLGQYGDGRPFYAMRFVRGDSLKAACVRFHQADGPGRDPGQRTLELRQLLGRFVDVCHAMQYAHDRGVLHRDLKPGNIMLGKYGETLVVDWGLAKAVGKFAEPATSTTKASATGAEEATLKPVSASDAWQTQYGSALGTPQYMSPEQAAGRLDLLGPASDVVGSLLPFKDLEKESWLRKAQARHPDDFWLNMAMGEAILSTKLVGAVPTTKAVEAEGFFRAGLALRPGNSAVYLNIGQAFLYQERVDEAIAVFQLVIELEPKTAMAYYNLGWAFFYRKQRPDEAIAFYRKSIELDPTYPSVYNNLGDIFRIQNRLDEAIAAFQKTISLDPKHINSHMNLATVYIEQQLLDKAIPLLEKAIELDPKLAGAYNNLGVVRNRQNREDEAITAFRKAIECNPKSAESQINLVTTLLKKLRVDEALAAHRKALEHNPKLSYSPNFAMAYYNLGLAHKSQKRVDEAIAAYQKAIELNPKFALAHFSLGNALRDQLRVDEAISAFQKTIELNPKYAEAHCNLGLVLLRQGQFAEALKGLKLGHELGSKQPAWKYPSAQWVKQCEQLLALDQQLTATMAGQGQPKNAAEQLALAVLCQRYKQQYAASAKFYADAFAAEPKTTEKLEGHRYNAACAAARGGTGQGKDADKLSTEEKVKLRSQGRAWLQANLDYYAKQMKGQVQLMQVVKSLQEWQRDPNLASVRDPKALSKLPQAERQDWEKLWSEVQQLLKESQAHLREK